jgi:hypothetical protein
MLQYDVIVTTYGTVAADFVRNRSQLHGIHWYRVILDEGTLSLPRCVRQRINSGYQPM